MDPPVPPWFRDLSFRVNLLPRKMAHAIPGRGTPRASTVVVNRVSSLFRANSFQPIFRIRFSENRSIFNSNRIMIIIIITPIKSTLPSSDYYQSDFFSFFRFLFSSFSSSSSFFPLSSLETFRNGRNRSLKNSNESLGWRPDVYIALGCFQNNLGTVYQSSETGTRIESSSRIESCTLTYMDREVEWTIHQFFPLPCEFLLIFISPSSSYFLYYRMVP